VVFLVCVGNVWYIFYVELRKIVIIFVGGICVKKKLKTCINKNPQIKSEIELLRNLAEAEEDVHAGRTASMKDTFADIRNTLKTRT